MAMKRLMVLACTVLILSGCSDNPCEPREKPGFEVRVLSNNLYGTPVEGAWIEGGFDWDAYSVRTDSDGVAVLPGSARGHYALIHKSNYLPRGISAIEPKEYWLATTPMRLEYVGKVSDTSIRFSSDMLLTLEYQGRYRAYSYCDTCVTELAETMLSGTAIRATRFYGDTLWYSTHDSGVFVYSVQDPLNPVHLFSLDIDGYLDAFAVIGHFIAVSDPWGHDPVRVFSYTSLGETSKVAEVDAFYVKQMEFMSHYLVILSYDALEFPYAELMVADLSDPADPEIVYTLEEQGALGGLIYGDTALIGPFSQYTSMRLSYTAIDLGDPGRPVYAGRKYSDSWLLNGAGESRAAGTYCPRNAMCYAWGDPASVLERTPEGNWETVATLSHAWYTGGSVHSPPYFVLGARLWRLCERSNGPADNPG
jgi:hypothetical protein